MQSPAHPAGCFVRNLETLRVFFSPSSGISVAFEDERFPPRDCPGRPQAPLYVGPSGGAFVPSRSRHSGASTQGAASARPFFSRGCFSFNARVLGHQKLAPQWRQLKLLWRLESAVMEPRVGLIVDSTPYDDPPDDPDDERSEHDASYTRPCSSGSNRT